MLNLICGIQAAEFRPPRKSVSVRCASIDTPDRGCQAHAIYQDARERGLVNLDKANMSNDNIANGHSPSRTYGVVP